MAGQEWQKRPADVGGRRPDWSALPNLPLVCIAGRLPTLKDFLSLRGVCTSWRSVGRAIEGDVMASHPPLLFENSRKRFYHPSEMRVYSRPTAVEASVAGFSQGHLILEKGGSPWLSNPLTDAENHCFPRAELPFCEAILSSPPTSFGCVLVAYDSYGIQYCRPGDKEWCVVYQFRDYMGKPDHSVICVSVVAEKGYALLGKEVLATFDFSGRLELTILKAEPPCPRLGMCSSVFLAESKGELFAFFASRLHLAAGFVVFRFDSLSCKWVQTQDLGGRALFVDRWRGSVFVDNYAKWGGSKDCIYFFDPYERQVLEYKVKDGRCELFLFPTEKPAIDSFAGVWVLPSLS